MDSPLGVIVILGIGFFGYFLPTLIALLRNHHNGISIFLLNLFLGWTFIGWVIALVWSTAQKDNRR